MWTRLRQTTSSKQVAQTVLSDDLLRPGGNTLLDTQRRALFVPPDRQAAYYVWDGRGWRELQAGDVRRALDRSRAELISLVERLVADPYPPEVWRIHIELFDSLGGEIDVVVFFFDSDHNEVFVDGRDLSCTLSVASAYPPGWDEPDVAGVPIEDATVLEWLGECAVEAGVRDCAVQVTAGFHDDDEWPLGGGNATDRRQIT